MAKCRDVMSTEPVYCTPDDPVTKVAILMKIEEIGSIPIVDDEQFMRPVGIITDRDLAIYIVAEKRDPVKTKVGEIMSTDLVTCYEDDDIDDAIDSMSQYQLRRIPIVSKEERLVGMIAQGDVATRVHEPKATAEMVKDISQPLA